MYMTGLRTVDFERVGDVWGTRPELARDRYAREEFEKRVFVTSCYLGWPGYRITSEKPALDGGTRLEVSSTDGGKEQHAALRLEANAAGRWFVAAADLSEVSPGHCS